MGKLDDAGRTIAGLIGYNPGPGIYSRLERAIEDMPANVRVQELPGLLKRYKEGVPGWEIKEVLTPDLTEGVQSIPRQDLLDAVKERSPVYTHKEIVLGGRPQMGTPLFDVPEYQESASSLGKGTSHGEPVYQDYGQGGSDYTELLLLQPNNTGYGYGNHWAGRGDKSQDAAVAHARFDTHGDALRINELQSDLGIHNRKAREGGEGPVDPLPEDDPTDWQFRVGKPKSPKPFPLEDAWSDILIKRLALEAARQGHRAIEIASPRAIADKVGGNIDNYEHFYGKVVPGAIERLGRKMGGLTPDGVEAAPVDRLSESPQYETHQQLRDHFRAATGDDQPGPNFWRLYSGMRYDSLPPHEQAFVYDRFGGSHPVSQVEGGLPQEMYDYLHGLGLSRQEAQGITSQAMYLAPHNARAMQNFAQQEQLGSLGSLSKPRGGEVGRRYIMSDEMRKRILTQGIGAAVAAPVLSDDDLIERLNQ